MQPSPPKSRWIERPVTTLFLLNICSLVPCNWIVFIYSLLKKDICMICCLYVADASFGESDCSSSSPTSSPSTGDGGKTAGGGGGSVARPTSPQPQPRRSSARFRRTVHQEAEEVGTHTFCHIYISRICLVYSHYIRESVLFTAIIIVLMNPGL